MSGKSGARFCKCGNPEENAISHRLLGGIVMNLRSWDIPSGSSSKVYTVDERTDVHGGVYLFCPCQGWAYQKGRGLDCKHVATVKGMLGFAPAIPRPNSIRRPDGTDYAAPLKISTAVPERVKLPVPDKHLAGMCGIPGAHTAEDHAAAVLLGAI